MNGCLESDKDAASPGKSKHCCSQTQCLWRGLTASQGPVFAWTTHSPHSVPDGTYLLDMGHTMGQNGTQWDSWKLRMQTRGTWALCTNRETRRQGNTSY